mgnify:CR=1 FL=1
MAIYKEGQIVTPQQNSRERAAAQGTYGGGHHFLQPHRRCLGHR